MPILLTAVGAAFTFGGTIAIARTKQAAQDAEIQSLKSEMNADRRETQEIRDRLIRIEVWSEQTAKTVERIEKRMAE